MPVDFLEILGLVIVAVVMHRRSVEACTVRAVLPYSESTCRTMLNNYCDEKRDFYIRLRERGGVMYAVCSASFRDNATFRLSMYPTAAGTELVFVPCLERWSKNSVPAYKLRAAMRLCGDLT